MKLFLFEELVPSSSHKNNFIIIALLTLFASIYCHAPCNCSSQLNHSRPLQKRSLGNTMLSLVVAMSFKTFVLLKDQEEYSSVHVTSTEYSSVLRKHKI